MQLQKQIAEAGGATAATEAALQQQLSEAQQECQRLQKQATSLNSDIGKMTVELTKVNEDLKKTSDENIEYKKEIELLR